MKYFYLALATLAIVIGGLSMWEAREAYIEHEAFERGYDSAMAKVTELELAAVIRGREEERRNTEAALKEADEARKNLAGATVALRDAVRFGDRLREQIKAADALRCRRQDPAPAGGSTPTDTAGDLLDLVRRRLDEATERTVEFADAAHIAGLACQRIHEAVTTP